MCLTRYVNVFAGYRLSFDKLGVSYLYSAIIVLLAELLRRGGGICSGVFSVYGSVTGQ